MSVWEVLVRVAWLVAYIAAIFWALDLLPWQRGQR